MGSTLIFLMQHEEEYVEFIKRNQKVELKEADWDVRIESEEVAALVKDIQGLNTKDREVYEYGIMAFTSFVRAYGKHECSLICQIKELDLAELATGLGLVTLPKMPELRGRDTSGFIPPPDIDITKIPYLDKAKEKKRLDSARNPTATATKHSVGGKKWNQAWSNKQDKFDRRMERRIIKKLKSAQSDALDEAGINCADADIEALATKLAGIKEKRRGFLTATMTERRSLKEKKKGSEDE